MSEMSGTVTQWLKPNQPLALWWHRNYPGLRQVSRDLAARLGAARTKDRAPNAKEPASPTIPVDTPGLLGGAVDYRMRMEFTRQWGGDPERSAFTRAWAGKRGSLAHAAARLLADCAPALASLHSEANPHRAQVAHGAHLAESPQHSLCCWRSEPPALTNWLLETGRGLTPLHSAKNPGSRTTALCWPSWTTSTAPSGRASISCHS